MAQEIKKEIGVEPQLIESRGGVFEVMKDGELIFSKKALNRFPAPGEVIEKLKS